MACYREIILAYKKKAKVLWKASPRFFVGLIVLSLIVGVGLPYVVIVYGDFLDTLVGARGVEIFTTDARQTGQQLLMAVGMTTVGMAFLLRLQGVARRWTFVLVEFLVVLGLILVALPVAIARIPLQVVAVLFSRAYRLGRWRWLVSLFVLFAFTIHAPAVVGATVYRELTVGEGMMFLLADMCLMIWSLVRIEMFGKNANDAQERAS